MNEEQRRQAKQLRDSGYLPTIEGWAKSISAPFWWHRDTGEIPTTLHNGTMCFIDTGSRLIGVTCAHVYDGYLADLKREPSLVCQLGATTTFDPCASLIDHDATLDLATFEVSRIIVTSAGSSTHNALAWPPTDADAEDLVLIGGWPGFTREERPGEIDISFASFITRVDSASADHLAIVLNLSDAEAGGSPALPHSPDLGGVSGGPVMLIREAEIGTMTLVGVVYEYHRSLEIVRARRASLLNPDGTLASP